MGVIIEIIPLECRFKYEIHLRRRGCLSVLSWCYGMYGETISHQIAFTNPDQIHDRWGYEFEDRHCALYLKSDAEFTLFQLRWT